MSETPLLFLIHPEAASTKVRKEIKASKELVQRLHVKNKAKIAAIVDADWYRHLIQWLSDIENEYPGPITNHKLCSSGKLEKTKKIDQDFVCIDPKGWDLLVNNFGGGPKILRNVVLNPKTHESCVLEESFVLTFIYEDKSYKKHAEPSWKVGPIFKQLCKKLDISPTDYVIKDMATGDEIKSNANVGEAVVGHSGPWTLSLTEEAMNKPPSGISIEKHEASDLGMINCNGGFSFFAIPLYSLYGVNRFRDLIFNPDLPNMLSKVTKKAGKTTAVVRNIFRGIKHKEGKGINADLFYNYIYNVDSTLQSDEEHSVILVLSIILSLLHTDTLREDQTSPITDIFSGVLHSTVECSVCNRVKETYDNCDFLKVPIPEDIEDVHLEDCISCFAVPEEIPPNERAKCSICGKAAKSTMCRTINKVGSVVIIFFKRYITGGVFEKKVKKFVKFPLSLHGSVFTRDCKDDYALKSVIYRKGEYESNEYASAILVDNEWNYADSFGSCKVNPNEIVNPEAFILIYEKV